MDLQEYLESCAKDTNKELEEFFPRKFTQGWADSFLGDQNFKVDLDASQKALVNPIWDFLDRGGKRWRPALLLLAAEAVGGSRDKALPFTVIPELIHNGTIMVDDVEDGSELRRGKKATHLLYGVDVAVNAGNAMYYLPLVKLFGNSGLNDSAKSKVYDLYSLEMLRLSFGQAMDIHWHNGNKFVSEEEYLQMCSYKTGSLARFAAELGAIVGGGSEEQVAALGSFATNIGVAFQIQDDILNLKPKEGWGKLVGDDIIEGKRTLLVIHALKVLNTREKNRLVEILDSQNNSGEEIKEAISLLDSADSFSFAKKKADDLVMGSWKKTADLLEDSDSKKLLKEFADYLVNRNI